ncbi:hypothetical protein [Actinoplanes sp. NPDC026623]|uniref:hypothetical protein n=1 Tax=Actinoplanes sp. NPDC026623 TaxID=3155610 RepID=UPI003407E1D5
MSDEQEPIDHELQQMTSNPRVAKATKEALNRLRQGVAGPELAEMATEVLEGRTDLRTIGRSSVYAAQLTEAAEGFREWHAHLSPEERDARDRSAHEYLGDADNG